MDSELLVVGYGNTLRRDDGVGPRVAEAVEELHLRGVRTLACPQLTPELADPLSRAGTAIFIDASVDGRRRISLRRIDPSDSSQILAHAANPCTLLALARDAFGHAPEAWMLEVPAEEIGFGDQLSPMAERGLRQAVRGVRSLLWRLHDRS